MNPDDLRKIADDPRYPGTDIVAACRQAADEIERLRSELVLADAALELGVRHVNRISKDRQDDEAKLGRYRKALEKITQCDCSFYGKCPGCVLCIAKEALADAADGGEKS